MEYDQIKTIRNSLIQEGPYNNRLYLMKLAKSDMPDILKELDLLAESHQRTKIFAKIPEVYAASFCLQGYVKEATIPGFYGGKIKGTFMAKFFSVDRKQDNDRNERETVLEKSLEKEILTDEKPVLEDVVILNSDDVKEMSRLYQSVFETYPFPIQDPLYLQQTMQQQVRYYGIRKQGLLVALSSAEMDREASNVEMTDFATILVHRKKGYAEALLNKMETDMKKEGLKTAYTIARAKSHGANMIFSKRGYRYGGTLINNTFISGDIESMNVWYKTLDFSL
jgi:putative beta-lysine N-acetyltransferase